MSGSRTDSGLSKHTPVPGRDVEQVLGRHIAARVVWVGPPLVALFWATRGAGGGLASALGVVIVVLNFLLAGFLLARSARISLSLYHAAALFGFFLRLGLITLTFVVIARLIEIDRLAMGISAVASYLVLLSWEVMAVARGAERELEWS